MLVVGGRCDHQTLNLLIYCLFIYINNHTSKSACAFKYLMHDGVFYLKLLTISYNVLINIFCKILAICRNCCIMQRKRNNTINSHDRSK